MKAFACLPACVDSCECYHDGMTASLPSLAIAAPVHFDLDMKLCSGVEWTPSLTPALTQSDNCEHMAACLIMVAYPPPLLRSGRSLGMALPVDTLSF